MERDFEEKCDDSSVAMNVMLQDMERRIQMLTKHIDTQMDILEKRKMELVDIKIKLSYTRIKSGHISR